MQTYFNGGAGFLDRDARTDTGEHGAYVTGEVARHIYFVMQPKDTVIVRGVMEMTDGRVYTWTVRAAGHADVGSGERRLATRMHGTYESVARGLLEMERSRILLDVLPAYEEQAEALERAFMR